MRTETIIQASANVARITELSKGDVYKRLVTSSYNDGDEIRYGVVLDVLNNGDTVAVQLMEWKTSYGTVETEFKNFSGGKDLAIFPATPEEISTYFEEALERMAYNVTAAEKALAEAKEKLAKATALSTGEFIKSIKTPTISSEPYRPELPEGTVDAEVVPDLHSDTEPF